MLQGLTTNVALGVASASFFVWFLTNLPKLADILHPVIRLQVINADSWRGAIANTGNRPVFISGVIYVPNPETGLAFRGTTAINQFVEPGKIVQYVSPDGPFFGQNHPHWFFVPATAGLSVLKETREADGPRCFEKVVFAKDDPDYVSLQAMTGKARKLLTVEATGVFTYYTPGSGSTAKTLSIPSVVLVQKNPDVDACGVP